MNSRAAAKADWVAFEEAVAAFLTTLDPSASVTPNVRLPDRHTGKPRQRDVWIQTRIHGHFPVSILVSCKRYNRKLNQQDIDAFEGERQSSSAQIGVIYSYRGFGKAALEKATRLGIACCRLYSNEPPELPLSLAVPSYCYRSQVAVHVLRLVGNWAALQTHGDLFALVTRDDGKSVLDLVVETFQELDADAVALVHVDGSVLSRRAEVLIEFERGPLTLASLQVEHRWQVYRGRIDAYLANGSYSETDGDFRGHIAFPSVDLRGDQPGPGWTLIPFPASIPEGPQLKTVLSQPDVRSGLIEALTSSPLDLVPIPSEAC